MTLRASMRGPQPENQFRRTGPRLAVWVVLITLVPVVAPAQTSPEPIALRRDDPVSMETVLEAMLSPAEFDSRRFVLETTGDEAQFALDAVLAASPPTVEVHPERVSPPELGGLAVHIQGPPLSLTPLPQLTDAALDDGFRIRWTLKALGQRFRPTPHFAALPLSVEIISADGKSLLAQRAEPARVSACKETGPRTLPRCRVDIGREVQAVSLSPDGNSLSLAFGGLRPRLEMWDIRQTPKFRWQVLFSKSSGGAVETAFSSDGIWVTALTGRGEMHRFDAVSGGRHMAVPSSGRTASAVPPGRIMAVAGTNGEVTLWYLKDGTVARRFPPRGNRGSVDRLAASGDGEVIATLEYTESETVIRAWNIAGRRLLRQLSIEGRSVVALALDREGKHVYVSHESKGLLVAPLHTKAPLSPVPGKEAPRCVGRIEWISAQNALLCSLDNALVTLDEKGNRRDLWKVDETASDWAAAASPGGAKLAAAGGGRLLIWWTR